MTAPWPEAPFPPNGFVEGGIDLNTLDFAGGAPPCFTSFLGETRASAAPKAELKNFGAGNLNTCGSIELKKVWADGPAGQTHLSIGKSLLTPHDVVGPVSAPPADSTGPQTVSPGLYHLSEDLQSVATPGGWHTDPPSCEGGSNVSNDNVPAASGTSYSVTVASGETVVCTYTNHFNKFTPSAGTTLHNAAGGAVVNNNDHLGLNSGVYDVATLTPANGNGFPYTGTVTFRFFTTIDCTGTAASEPGVAVSGNTAQSSNHLTLAAGNYSFNAQYIAGTDTAHNDSVVSGCEPFVINPATPTADTTLHNAAGARS